MAVIVLWACGIHINYMCAIMLCDVKQTVIASYTETIFMLGTNNFTPMVTGQVVDLQWLYLVVSQ